ncbi:MULTISPECIES: competence protein CoiA [Aerococcus]|uniref:Competence protein CoiA-like protein n=1 Tax=Aerococcus tenax TaxID=3078812 RepID=A0A5N1BRK2_9LACT|nr:competence protein CoiA family protein [Aerococcus urinae]KAA9242725.1 hypothetical protein F6I34_00750 [Aerococcus urinae]MDK6370915.1 competence protein CoiA family protein [Aerococcus urinae]MDK6597286.1 competence protein CoiA family protein [Aerococcus urinae]MDK7301878.1 competence protein CoiA family protein [Aerococcus urinae]MDK7801171.1 competence protein CoiA family protein [Aerococcus urinae]
MYYAKLANGQLISSYEVDDRIQRKILALNQQSFYCPNCGQELVYRCHSRKKPHFAHQNNQLSLKYWRRESHWHLNNKEQIRQILVAKGYQAHVEVASYTPDHRSDILFQAGDVVVSIELQASLLTKEAVISREQDYHRAKVQVLWLLNPKQRDLRLTSNNLNRLAPFFQYLPCFGTYLPYWVEETRLVEIQSFNDYGHLLCRYHLSIDDYLYLFSYPKQVGLLNQEGTSGPGIRQLLKVRETRSLRRKIRQRPLKAEKKLLEQLYFRKLSLDDLPDTCFFFRGESIYIKEKLWLLAAYVFLLKEENLLDSEIYTFLLNYLNPRPFRPQLSFAYENWLWQISQVMVKLL